MKTYTINHISDNDGIKTVITCENISKVWYLQWYDFNREIKQVQNIEVVSITAEGFNHAKDLYNFHKNQERYRTESIRLQTKINALESQVLTKFGKLLKGKQSKSKINSFLRGEISAKKN